MIGWLGRHAWQLLLAMTALIALIALIGLKPDIEGIHEDPSVPLAFTGMTPDQLQTDNPQSYRLVDIRRGTRSGATQPILQRAHHRPAVVDAFAGQRTPIPAAARH